MAQSKTVSRPIFIPVITTPSGTRKIRRAMRASAANAIKFEGLREDEEIIAYINSKNIGGIEELKADVSIGKPEMLVHIDREAARTYQISTFGIANSIRTSVFGKEISKFKQGEDEFPINLRLADEYRYKKENLLNQKITFRNPANGRISQVPISTVADLSYSSTYSSINRKDQERMITIYSNVLDGYNGNEVVDEIKSVLADYEMPTGYTYTFTGQQEEMADQMAFLSTQKPY